MFLRPFGFNGALLVSGSYAIGKCINYLVSNCKNSRRDNIESAETISETSLFTRARILSIYVSDGPSFRVAGVPLSLDEEYIHR
jgi:hypothetical protein